MSLSLLLLLVSAVQAPDFYGTVMTYYPEPPDASGAIAVRSDPSGAIHLTRVNDL